jgi:hypothetical protein
MSQPTEADDLWGLPRLSALRSISCTHSPHVKVWRSNNSPCWECGVRLLRLAVFPHCGQMGRSAAPKERSKTLRAWHGTTADDGISVLRRRDRSRVSKDAQVPKTAPIPLWAVVAAVAVRASGDFRRATRLSTSIYGRARPAPGRPNGPYPRAVASILPAECRRLRN